MRCIRRHTISILAPCISDCTIKQNKYTDIFSWQFIKISDCTMKQTNILKHFLGNYSRNHETTHSINLNAETGMAQWWERSPPTNVARVRIWTRRRSEVGWVCCWFSSRFEGFSLSSKVFHPASTKTNICKFQFDQDKGPKWKTPKADAVPSKFKMWRVTHASLLQKRANAIAVKQTTVTAVIVIGTYIPVQ